MTPAQSQPPLIGQRLYELRQKNGNTLDELSRLAGVSKSMLSQIERDQVNPTLAVMWRLTKALGIDLPDLLVAHEDNTESSIDVLGRHATPTINSPDGLCRLSILGPADLIGTIEWYNLNVQPGGILESNAHQRGAREHLTVLHGELTVTSGTVTEQIVAGETARYPVDITHSIHNPSAEVTAEAILVVQYTPYKA